MTDRERKMRKSASVLRARYRSPEAHRAYLEYQREYREREKLNAERRES